MSLWLRSKKCGVVNDRKCSSHIHFHLDRCTVDAHCHGHWLTVKILYAVNGKAIFTRSYMMSFAVKST